MMARTRAIDRLRSRQARGDAATSDLDSLPTDAVSPPDQLIASQQAAGVREALLALPSDQKVALELAYFEGLTQSEIAERLQTPLGTVKTRIRAGMMAMRERLEQAR
jgi:RNA polymerase sigma-70 factor (ECF subfamily)